MILNTTNVYTCITWAKNFGDKKLMFKYNKKSKYYAYINGHKYLSTGVVEYIPTHNTSSKGMFSRVGQHILERLTLRKVVSLKRRVLSLTTILRTE